MATGLGSMIAPQLASSLCSLRAPVYTVSVTYPGNQLSIVHHAATIQVRATDSGGVGLTYGATGLPPGLAINPANGLITGAPTVAGSYTVSAGDADANDGSTAFNWAVVTPQPPTFSGGSLRNLAKAEATLSFALIAGLFEPPITSFSFSVPRGVSFVKKTSILGKAIVLKSADGRRVKYSPKLSRGVLTITLKSPQIKLSCSIAPPATLVSANLAGKVKHRKVRKLTVVIKVVDSSRATTKLTLELRV